MSSLFLDAMGGLTQGLTQFGELQRADTDRKEKARQQALAESMEAEKLNLEKKRVRLSEDLTGENIKASVLGREAKTLELDEAKLNVPVKAKERGVKSKQADVAGAEADLNLTLVNDPDYMSRRAGAKKRELMTPLEKALDNVKSINPGMSPEDQSFFANFFTTYGANAELGSIRTGGSLVGGSEGKPTNAGGLTKEDVAKMVKNMGDIDSKILDYEERLRVLKTEKTPGAEEEIRKLEQAIADGKKGKELIKATALSESPSAGVTASINAAGIVAQNDIGIRTWQEIKGAGDVRRKSADDRLKQLEGGGLTSPSPEVNAPAPAVAATDDIKLSDESGYLSLGGQEKAASKASDTIISSLEGYSDSVKSAVMATMKKYALDKMSPAQIKKQTLIEAEAEKKKELDRRPLINQAPLLDVEVLPNTPTRAMYSSGVMR